MLAGIILAEAAIIDGLNAVQTQSYGPEARGGASKAEVVLSDTDIDYPKAVDPDFLLALTAEAYRAYGSEMTKGTIIIDSSIEISKDIKAKTLAFPILDTARNELENRVVANIVALGVLGAVSGIIDFPTFKLAVRNRVPKGTEKLNARALHRGFSLVKAMAPDVDDQAKEEEKK